MRRGNFKIRLFIGIAIVAFAYLRKCSQSEVNPYTGKSQSISLSPEQEIAIGLQQAPSMAQQHGGLYQNQQAQDLVDKVGKKLVDHSIARKSGYKYEFHLLRDERAINAFAVLGHEIGHVLGKHSNERITNANFWKLLTMGASVGADLGQLANGIGQQTLLKNGRGDELESDELGVKLMIDAGYNPEDLIGVMQILKAAAGPNRIPEFQSSHPDPENRIAKIKEAIRRYRK